MTEDENWERRQRSQEGQELFRQFIATFEQVADSHNRLALAFEAQAESNEQVAVALRAVSSQITQNTAQSHLLVDQIAELVRALNYQNQVAARHAVPQQPLAPHALEVFQGVAQIIGGPR